MASPCPQTMESSEEASFRIKVLHFGHAFSHKIPYWPAISVDLRVMKYTFTNTLNDDVVYHGLIKDDSSLLDLARPFELFIIDEPDHCFVKTEVKLL